LLAPFKEDYLFELVVFIMILFIIYFSTMTFFL